ncbi:MAG: tetratricopeptide repeat protein [Verrucomicrobiota bacterium]
MTRCDFVGIDDPDYVSGNPQVLAGITTQGVAWAFQTFHRSNWHPVTWLSHMLDAELFGPGPAGPHWVNLLLHAGNSVLLFVLLQSCTRRMAPSAAVAALFALHPAHVESVAWISERKDVLSTFFGLLAIMAYVKGSRGSKVESRGPEHSISSFRLSTLDSGLSTGLFALSLLSKPMLVTLPLILLLLDFWPLGRFAGNAAFPQRLRTLVIEKIPFFVLSAMSCVITVIAQKHGGAVADLSGLPLSARLANAVVSVARYLAEFIWPTRLAIIYPHPGHWPMLWIAGSALLIALLTVLAFASWRRGYPVTGWLWFLITLVPVIGILQVGAQAMADRYTYFPYIGLFIVVAWAVTDLVSNRRKAQFAAGIVLGFALGACAWQTRYQLQFWRNSAALFSRAISVTENNYLAHFDLGVALAAAGRDREAVEQYEISHRLNPDFVRPMINLGQIAAGQGRLDDALRWFQSALRIAPDSALLHSNLGAVYAMMGRMDDARREFAEAVRLDPKNADACNNLGRALEQGGDLEGAMQRYRQAIALQPGNLQARINLANALTAANRLNEAIAQWREILLHLPNLPEAHFKLGLLMARSGQKAEATAELKTALKLQPDNPDIQAALKGL